MVSQLSHFKSVWKAKLLAKMSQATIQMSEAIIPTQERQINFLEKRIKKRNIVYLIVGTTIPVFIYFLTMYITTAITAQTTIGATIFLFTAVPASIGLIFFAISFYFLKNPIIKGIYNYPIKAVSLVGAFIYSIYTFYGLVYNRVSFYPILSLLYLPLIIIPLKTRKSMGSLLLLLAGENKNKAIKDLVLKKDLKFDKILENFDVSPPIFNIWLSLILTKRGERTAIKNQILSMLTSNYPLIRATASLCLLYGQDADSLETMLKLLENDKDPRVRNAIAYGFRYFNQLPIDLYKRVIDAQHYEDDSTVLETLKHTISIFDQRIT
ncbi:MAG: hypothetical protein ACTSSG_13695, partial [Candidatus Heimdallarchaeaceae archaeon]